MVVMGCKYYSSAGTQPQPLHVRLLWGSSGHLQLLIHVEGVSAADTTAYERAASPSVSYSVLTSPAGSASLDPVPEAAETSGPSSAPAPTQDASEHPRSNKPRAAGNFVLRLMSSLPLLPSVLGLCVGTLLCALAAHHLLRSTTPSAPMAPTNKGRCEATV